MKNFVKAAILLCFLAGIQGCAQTFTGPRGGQYKALSQASLWENVNYRTEYRQHYAETTPGLTDRQRELIANGRIAIGMSPEMVRASWGLYGLREPEITQSIDQFGKAQFWRERNPYDPYHLSRWTLYFRNDELRDITQHRQ